MFVLKILTVLFCMYFVGCEDEMFMNTAQILENRNISYESHEVMTKDGYFLTIFRIPKKERRGVVILHHSLSLDSSVFFVSPKRSIAMEVYSAGYEIWLPNFRGLPFSTKHANPNIPKLDYWDFSFHEIGYYDFPAIINHVTNLTSTKVIILGHSLSSTAALVYCSLKPSEAEGKVKVFINLASSAFMNHTTTPMKYLIEPQFSIMKPIMKALNLGAIHYDFVPYMAMTKQIALDLISKDTFLEIGNMFVDFLFGPSGMGMDPEEFPTILSICTQPVTAKILYHYSQMIKSGRFCEYDYGPEDNFKKFNQTSPPDYPLEAIKVPIYIVASDADILSDSWGSNVLYEKLPEKAKIYGKLDIQGVNHADYLVGKDRFVYFQKIMDFINSVK